MNAEDINVGDEVGCVGNWLRVTHIEGNLVVGRHENGEPNAWFATYIDDVRRPKTPLGYEKVFNGDYCRYPVEAVLADLFTTHVVTHWSDGTCTLDTIAAFREAHQ